MLNLLSSTLLYTCHRRPKEGGVQGDRPPIEFQNPNTYAPTVMH